MSPQARRGVISSKPPSKPDDVCVIGSTQKSDQSGSTVKGSDCGANFSALRLVDLDVANDVNPCARSAGNPPAVDSPEDANLGSPSSSWQRCSNNIAVENASRVNHVDCCAGLDAPEHNDVEPSENASMQPAGGEWIDTPVEVMLKIPGPKTPCNNDISAPLTDGLPEVFGSTVMDSLVSRTLSSPSVVEDVRVLGSPPPASTAVSTPSDKVISSPPEITLPDPLRSKNVESKVERILRLNGGPIDRDIGSEVTVADLYWMMSRPDTVVLEYDWSETRPSVNVVELMLRKAASNRLRRLVHIATMEFVGNRRFSASVNSCCFFSTDSQEFFLSMYLVFRIERCMIEVSVA